MAALATGCTKDKNGYVRIFAENFNNGGAKVAFTPATGNDATWIPGEKIWLNGDVYDIMESDGQYYLANGLDPMEIQDTPYPDMYAIYPGDNFGGDNTLYVEASDDEHATVTMEELVLKLKPDGKQEMVFPMGAYTPQNLELVDGASLMFKHLTAGLKLNINGNGNIYKLKVIVKSDDGTTLSAASDNPDPIFNNFDAQWVGSDFPPLPAGPAGTNGDSYDVKYSCEMNFDLEQGSYSYINFNGGKTICVPLTVSKIDRIVVIGYSNSTGTQEAFNVTKNFSAPVNVERNVMYSVPEITY